MVDRPSAIAASPLAPEVSPVRFGMVTDSGACARLVRWALAEAGAGGPLRGVVLAVPVAAGGHHLRRAVTAVRSAAGCPVRTVDAPLAAAIGAGLPGNDPRPRLVMDIGAGIVEAVVIMDGRVVQARSVQYVPVAAHIGSKPTPGEPTSSGPISSEPTGGGPARGGPARGGPARGGPACGGPAGGGPAWVPLERGLRAGLPWYVIALLAGELLGLLEDLPVMLRAQARDRGLLLTGGGARLPYLPGAMTAGTGLTVTVAHDPARATIRGLARL